LKKNKTQAPYPDEMVDLNGQKLKTNQEKKDEFVKTFVKKTEKMFQMKSTIKKKNFFIQLKKTGCPSNWLKKL
jgi:hypothetical protein